MKQEQTRNRRKTVRLWQITNEQIKETDDAADPEE